MAATTAQIIEERALARIHAPSFDDDGSFDGFA